MANVSVTQLAKTIGVTADELLIQLQKAGMAVHDVNYELNDQEKQTLLKYLQNSKPDFKDRSASTITLKRKSLSQVKSSAGIKGKTVSVEVRKKRTYVQESISLAEEQAKAEQEAKEREAAQTEN